MIDNCVTGVRVLMEGDKGSGGILILLLLLDEKCILLLNNKDFWGELGLLISLGTFVLSLLFSLSFF